MPRAYLTKSRIKAPGWDGTRLVCPAQGCRFKTEDRKVYKVHYEANHLDTFRFICDRCWAGFNRRCDLNRHAGGCLGSKEANDKKRCKKLRYVSVQQHLATLPSDPEEKIQELEEENRKLKLQLETLQEVMRMQGIVVASISDLTNNPGWE